MDQMSMIDWTVVFGLYIAVVKICWPVVCATWNRIVTEMNLPGLVIEK